LYLQGQGCLGIFDLLMKEDRLGLAVEGEITFLRWVHFRDFEISRSVEPKKNTGCCSTCGEVNVNMRKKNKVAICQRAKQFTTELLTTGWCEKAIKSTQRLLIARSCIFYMRLSKKWRTADDPSTDSTMWR